MSKSMRQDGASKRDQHSRARTDQELDGVNGGSSHTANTPAAARRLRNTATRNAQPERAMIAAQSRKQAIKILEETLEQAGVDVHKLSRAFARNRKQTSEAIAALRPRVDVPPATSFTDRLGNRFRRLRPLAGLTVPLAPPSLTFLNAPASFTMDQTDSYFLQSSLEPDNTFFRANFSASRPGDAGTYTFTYVWNNDTDTAMLTSVSTALELLGGVYAAAGDGDSETLWQVRTETDVGGGVELTIAGDGSATDAVSHNFVSVVAETALFELSGVYKGSGMTVDENQRHVRRWFCGAGAFNSADLGMDPISIFHHLRLRRKPVGHRPCRLRLRTESRDLPWRRCDRATGPNTAEHTALTIALHTWNRRASGSWRGNTERYPKDQYETVVESWREIQSYNIEFVMRRLREPLG